VVEDFGDFDEGVGFDFVFEGEPALVVGFAEDVEEAGDVGFGGVAFVGFHFHLELDVDGVGGDFFEVGVGVGGVEVAAVEVDASPGAIGGLDHFDEVLGFSDDAAVVFEAEEDAFFGGVVEAFLVGGGAVGDGFFDADVLGHGTGEDADVRGIHDSSVVDPFFDRGDFGVEFRAFGESEVVADSGAGELDATEVGVAFDLEQEGVVYVGREEVAGDFGAGDVVVGAPVDEVEDGPGFAVALEFLLFATTPLEGLAEAVGGEAELHAAFASAIDGFDGGEGEGGGGEGAEGGGEEVAAVHGGEEGSISRIGERGARMEVGKGSLVTRFALWWRVEFANEPPTFDFTACGAGFVGGHDRVQFDCALVERGVAVGGGQVCVFVSA